MEYPCIFASADAQVSDQWPLSSSLRKKMQNKQKQIYRHKTNILVLCVAMGVCDGVSNWTFREFSPKFSAIKNITFLCGDSFSDQLSSFAEISTGRLKCPKPLVPTNYNEQRDVFKCVCKKIQEESKWNTIPSREMFLFPVIIFSKYTEVVIIFFLFLSCRAFRSSAVLPCDQEIQPCSTALR